MASTTPIDGYTDPDFPNPMGPHDSMIIIYGYTPSLALAVLAIVLFAIAAMMHLWLLIRYRTWYFSTILVGTFMEIVGYIFRLLSSQQDPYSVIWFVVQYFLIVVAPVMFSAAIYVTVSKMIQVYGGNCAPLPPKLIIWIFVACDVVSTIVQIAGAALVGVAYSNQKDPATYNHILLAGLAFQVASFAIYLFILAATLYKARNSTKSIDRGFVLALLVATLAVYLRTCFRLAETAEGLMAMLSTHEVYYGCLEFAPIVIAVFLFTWWRPGRWLHESRDRAFHGEVEMARG